MYFAANKHRHIEPSLEEDIKRDREECLRDVGLIGFDAVRLAGEEVIDRSSLLNAGPWSVTMELQRDGLLFYILSSRDLPNGTSIQFRCQALNKNITGRLLGSFKADARSPTSFYLTYSVDIGDLRQLRVHWDNAGLFYLDKPSDAPTTLIQAFASASDSVLVSVQGMSAKFSAEGFPPAVRDWMHRCGL